jgi:transmembrane sensor
MTTKDFLTDPNFVKWVNHPTLKSDAYWKNWMSVHPEHLSELKLARELLLRVRYKEIEVRPGTKRRILEDILNAPPPAQEPSTVRESNDKHVPISLWEKAGQFARIAAILLVIITFSWLIYQSQGPDPSPALSQTSSLIHKNTAPGEKMQLTLPDGTRVWLNSVSGLEFPAEFDTEERLVKLTGEAFFEVEKDSLRPFKVLAGQTVTEAVGTSFNINTRTSGKVNISLFTGKVKVDTPFDTQGVFLDPGSELKYDANLKTVTVNGFNPTAVIGWKDGRLIFTESTLPEAVRLLEDWYGVKIQLKNDEKIHWKYSGEYQRQTLDNVLNSMAYIQKFKYSIEGDKVELTF